MGGGLGVGGMRKLVPCVTIVAMLAACATRNPKVDMTNVDRIKYDADLQECRDQSDAPFRDVWKTTALGALAGGGLVAGGLSNQSGQSKEAAAVGLLIVAGAAAIGAVVGLVVGAAGRPESGKALAQCMKDRGYGVNDEAPAKPRSPSAGESAVPDDLCPPEAEPQQLGQAVPI